MYCNLRPPEPRQPFYALITTPYHVSSRWTYPLPYYSVFAADTLLYAIELVTLTFDLEHCSVLPVTCWNSLPSLNAIEQSAAELLRFQCLTLWPWALNIALRAALGSGIIFTKFDLRQLTYLNYSVFWCWYVMSCSDLDIWPVDLESSWYIKRHVVKVCTKFEWNRAISSWIIDNFANCFTRYVTLWSWPLTSWPWTFTALRISCV